MEVSASRDLSRDAQTDLAAALDLPQVKSWTNGLLAHLIIVPAWVLPPGLLLGSLLLAGAPFGVAGLLANLGVAAVLLAGPKSARPALCIFVLCMAYRSGDRLAMAAAIFASFLTWLVTRSGKIARRPWLFEYVSTWAKDFYAETALRGALDDIRPTKSFFGFHPHGCLSAGFTINGTFNPDFMKAATRVAWLCDNTLRHKNPGFRLMAEAYEAEAKNNVPAVAFFGWSLLPFLPRPQSRLLTYVGKGIDLPQIPEPSNEDVDHWHKVYMEGLQKLFDENKADAGYPDRSAGQEGAVCAMSEDSAPSAKRRKTNFSDARSASTGALNKGVRSAAITESALPEDLRLGCFEILEAPAPKKKERRSEAAKERPKPPASPQDAMPKVAAEEVTQEAGSASSAAAAKAAASKQSSQPTAAELAAKAAAEATKLAKEKEQNQRREREYFKPYIGAELQLSGEVDVVTSSLYVVEMPPAAVKAPGMQLVVALIQHYGEPGSRAEEQLRCVTILEEQDLAVFPMQMKRWDHAGLHSSCVPAVVQARLENLAVEFGEEAAEVVVAWLHSVS
ncbi:Diacylglycerol O-acyltransferase 2 [Symbiodinium microadriaticum]|uniref:diacylglycerol O-acyltransferase n=1 Tax=Symbiodinium microadriaticum TaxID=2951 RepID=A0A1Q9EAU1_SYMMI|nr:Diacylglycerol O-acyltransferase 2 [Symbiodinium microadriaticum]